MTVERVSARPRFAWVDYGRFYSALAVVLFHFCSNGILTGSVGEVQRFPIVSSLADYGFLGVHFFFIVSGFVIFFSAAARTPGEFLASRIVRLVPAFIVSCSLTALVMELTGRQDITIDQFLANLTMVPTLFGQPYVDGVYWTLLLEILFYSGVFFAMVTGLIGHPRTLIFVAITVLISAQLLDKTVPFFGEYAGLFVLGAALSLHYREPSDRLIWLAISASTLLVLHATHAAAVLRLKDFPQLLPWVVTTTVGSFVAIFILLRTSDVSNVDRARQFGSLTYPLYLLHAHLGYAALAEVQSNDTKWIYTPLVVAGALFLAWLVAKYVENVPKKIWQKVAELYVSRPVDAFLTRSGREAGPASPVKES